MDKCPRCGYEPKEEYCQCRDLVVFDLVYELMTGHDYCRNCERRIKKTKVNLILAKGI